MRLVANVTYELESPNEHDPWELIIELMKMSLLMDMYDCRNIRANIIRVDVDGKRINGRTKAFTPITPRYPHS